MWEAPACVTILLHGGDPEKPQTAAADWEVMLKKTIKQRLRGMHVCLRQFRRQRRLRKAVFFVLLVAGINFLTAACGQGEVLTLRTSGASAEPAGAGTEKTKGSRGTGRAAEESTGSAELNAEGREEASLSGGRDTASESVTAGLENAGAAEWDNSPASGRDSPEDPERETAAAETGNGSQGALYVYVCGAVERPGVYSFPEGARVCDAIAAAGGLTLDADETCVNQALKLSDQDQIYIRTLEERDKALESGETEGVLHAGVSSSANAAKEPEDTGLSGTGAVKINLNTATQQELMSLRGIGETKAAAILAYRQEHGFFAKTEDLKKVSGIGDATYEKLKDQIMADSP